MSKEVVINAVYSKLNRKVNDLENKIPDVSTLIQKNQYSKDKNNLEKTIREIRAKYPILVV